MCVDTFAKEALTEPLGFNLFSVAPHVLLFQLHEDSIEVQYSRLVSYCYVSPLLPLPSQQKRERMVYHRMSVFFVYVM